MLHKQYNTDYGSGAGLSNTADHVPVTSQDFIKEFTQPAKPSADTVVPPPPPTPVMDAGGGFFRLKEEPPKAEEPAPIFTPVEEPEAGKKTASTVDGISLETFLKVRNMLQSQLFAMIAKSGNTEKYQLDDAQLDLLAEAYAPYADKISGMLPPWVMVAAVEAITTGKMLYTAYEDRQAAIRNAQAIKTGAPAQALRKAAATIVPLGNQPRTQFKIHSDGSFTTHRDGSYAAVGTAEKVNLSDMEEVRQVIIKNKWAKFAKAFGLDDTYLQQHGIDLEKLYESEFE